MVDVKDMDKKLLEVEVVKCRALNKIYVVQIESLLHKMKKNNERRDEVDIQLLKKDS